jgi:allantoinase
MRGMRKTGLSRASTKNREGEALAARKTLEAAHGERYDHPMSPARHHGRYPYSPIAERPAYDWPDGKRLAVYIGLNLEWFSFGEGHGAELAPGGPQPDVLNYAWRDYGNRVGVFRLAELFAELKLPVSLIVNAEMVAQAPQALAAFHGAEIVGHGRTNSEHQGTLSEDDERGLIADATAALATYSGSAPHGWLGPWISQSHVTPDLLQEAGYRYLLDWCHDDQPVWMKTRNGRILSVPYPQELNDIPQIVGRKREGADFADMIVDAFDVMQAECSKRPLVMGIALHPYIVGQPHRFKHLARALRAVMARADSQVWFTTAGAIAGHAAQLPDGTVP